MKKLSSIILLGLLALGAVMADEPKEKRWWEKRNEQRPDLYFPHNAHDQAMEESGVLCLACHPFNKIDETDPAFVSEITALANEPLEAICHSCHVEDRSAPTECRLCHPDPKKIWPRDHDLDYVRLHGPDGLENEQACASCHLDLNYCVDCHFRRDAASHREHGLGYRLSHGLEARMDAQKCGSCHNPSYCFDCHREIGP